MTVSTSTHPLNPKHAPSRLSRVFWLYGVLPSNLLWAVALWSYLHGSRAITATLFALLLLFTAWIIPTVWRAAPTAGQPGLGMAARGLTVAWGLNTVLLVFFLTLQRVNQ